MNTKLTEKNTPILKALTQDVITNDALFWPRHEDVSEEKIDDSDIKELPPYIYQTIMRERFLATKGVQLYDYIRQEWPTIRKEISHVQVISEPFYENMTLCAEKLWPLLQELSGKRLMGTLVTQGITFCYNLVPDFLENDLSFHGYFFALVKDYLVAAVFSDSGVKYDFLAKPTMIGNPLPEKDFRKGKVLVKSDMRDISDDELEEVRENLVLTKRMQITKICGTILLYELFRKYANIQVVETVPHKKLRLQNDETLMVDSETRVEYVDCSWFTTIVRSEGFKVRGHFRLQHYGKEMKEVKLIYIDEFEKYGYTRRAKKLLEIGE